MIGRIAALNRFISKSPKRNLSFLKVLQGSETSHGPRAIGMKTNENGWETSSTVSSIIFLNKNASGNGTAGSEKASRIYGIRKQINITKTKRNQTFFEISFGT